MIQKQDYHDWPLFREFRKSEEFLIAFKRIYRKDFSEELKERIEKDSEEKKKKK